jgi:autotransporter-associated beta strand protein
MKRSIRLLIALGVSLPLVGTSASAQSVKTWTSGDGGNGLFRNTLNWASGTVPVTGNGLVFGVTTGATSLTNDLSIASNNPAWSGITFNADSAAYTISGSAMTMANLAVITNNSSATQTFATNFDVGSSAVGARSFSVVGAGNVALSGAITQANGFQGHVTMNGQGALTLSGSIANNMNLVVNAGAVVLAKTGGVFAFNGYASGNQLNNGTLRLGGSNQFSADFTINGGTFDLNGFDTGSGSSNTAGFRSLQGTGGLITNAAAGSGTSVAAFGGANGYGAGSFGGTIADGATAKVAVLVSTNQFQPLFQVLSGSNAYTGGTRLTTSQSNFGPATLSIADVRSIGSAGSRTVTFDTAGSQAGVLQITGTAIQSGAAFDALVFNSGRAVGFDIADPANSFTLGQSLNQGAGVFTKRGAGTMVLTASNSYIGATNLLGGTLRVDTQAGGSLASTTTPNFSGGVLSVRGKTTGSTTQSLGNVTLSTGGGGLVIDGNGGAGTTVALGTLANSTNAGSGLDIQIIGSATATTTTTSVTNGLLGNGRVTFRSGANADFAAIAASGTPRVIQAATYTTGLPAAPSSAATNYSQADNASVTTTGTVNALKITTTTSGQALTIAAGQTLSFASGGVLFTGADNYDISGGSIASQTATNSDLLIHQFGAGSLTIGSTVANGVGASTLTKTGTGLLELTAANTYTGQTYVNGGTLAISSNANLGAAATGAQLNLDGGTLRVTGNVALDNAGGNKRAVRVGSSGGGFDAAASGTLTISGVLTAAGMVTKTGSGVLLLTSPNNVTGGVTIEEGTLRLGSKGAIEGSSVNNDLQAATSGLRFGSGASPTLQLNGNNTRVTSLVSSNTAAVVESNSASAGTDTITVYNGADNTFAGILRNGSTRALALGKTGGGTLFLTNTTSSFSGGLTIFNGRVSVSQAALGSGTVTFSGGGLDVTGSSAVAFANGLSASSGFTNSVTVSNTAGATFSGVVSGSGSLTKSGAGSLTLSNAANVFTGSLTSSSGTIGFASVGSAAGLVMAGGHFTATAGSTTVGSLAMNSAGTLLAPGAQVTISSLTGSGALTVTGSSWQSGLRLTGTASTGFSGSINVGVSPGGSNGFLVLAHENALGSNVDALTMGQGGGTYLRDDGSALTIANHRINVASGGVALAPTASSGDLTITGGITGSGGVTFRSQASRAIVLGGTANDYSGQSMIYTDDANNSTVRLAATNAVPFGAGKGNLQFAVWNTGTALLDLGGFSTTINGLSQVGTGAVGRIIDNVSAGGAVTLTLGAGNATGNTFGGIIRNSSGTIALTKIGTGIQTLGGANTYAGATTISGGTLALGLNGSFASSPLITIGSAGSSGAVLDLTAKTGTFAFGAGQTVGGIGTLKMDASDTVQIAGVLSPGNSPGVLTFDGGTALLSGTTQMEIFGGVRGTDYDAVDLINNAILDYANGTLLLDFGATLAAEQTYQLFGNGPSTLQGDLFAVTVAGSNYAGLTFTGSNGVWTSTGSSPSGQTLTFTEATGQLVIVPEPAALALAACGIMGVVWSLRRRGRHRE